MRGFRGYWAATPPILPRLRSSLKRSASRSSNGLRRCSSAIASSRLTPKPSPRRLANSLTTRLQTSSTSAVPSSRLPAKNYTRSLIRGFRSCWTAASPVPLPVRPRLRCRSKRSASRSSSGLRRCSILAAPNRLTPKPSPWRSANSLIARFQNSSTAAVPNPRRPEGHYARSLIRGFRSCWTAASPIQLPVRPRLRCRSKRSASRSSSALRR